jgi:protease-4
MAADEIQAYPTSITGSIGVIGMGLNFSGLMAKLGIENQTIQSGAFKDTGSPLRSMRDDERAYMQGIIDELHARFREVVVAGRPNLDAARVAELADGRIYSANGALSNGLIDRIGSIEEAIDRLEELAGISESQVVSYHRPSEWRNNLYTGAPALAGPPIVQLDLRQMFGPLPKPGFHYLWLPQLD